MKHDILTYVFDLDGTTSDDRWRRHLVERPEPDYDAYQDAALQDQPVGTTRDIVRSLYSSEALPHIAFITGREERYRPLAERWLSIHSIPYHGLHMCPDGNREPNEVTKELYVKELAAAGHEILAAFDDDPVTVAHLRKLFKFVVYHVQLKGDEE